ncbi:hypothetical protein HanPSC8_Chr10g0433441 [Helianthus annuus]|nr:hypothetical protein HanPSC8_Chr10g0433441 [Helianthus annuus]
MIFFGLNGPYLCPPANIRVVFRFMCLTRFSGQCRVQPAKPRTRPVTNQLNQTKLQKH